MLVRAYLLLSLLTCPSVLAAQSFAYSYSGTPRPNRPYSATFEAKTVQTLADGTTITTTIETKEARDSQGRTLHQSTRTMPGGNKFTQTYVNDPTERTTTHWSSTSTVASVDHFPDPAEMSRPARADQVKQQAQPEPGPRPTVQKETLGTKTIFGVQAEGTRTTRIIPAGLQGNDRPLTIVNEQWRSSDLGILLSVSRGDPISGHFTQEVTELNLGEPDPAVFQLPAGYTLQEREQPK